MLLENSPLECVCGGGGVMCLCPSFLPSPGPSFLPTTPSSVECFLSKATTVSLLSLLLAKDKNSRFPCDMYYFSIKIINMRIFMEPLLIQRSQSPHPNLH